MEKSSRPVRNRRHSRRVWPPGDTHRPVKRLFTPEIKRMLKDWLVRRRDNPYPSRDEKKILAHETGLTYTQICNWFANWRRKLKNSGREPAKKTWGHLIKNYNVNAKGNVEQFSICSNDSIWGDEEHCSQLTDDTPTYSENYDQVEGKDNCSLTIFNNNSEYFNREYQNDNCQYTNGYYVGPDYHNNLNSSPTDHCYTPRKLFQPQCFQVSSTTDDQQSSTIDDENYKNQQQGFTSNTKYKQQMMEKYLRDTSQSSSASTSSPELSKWLESAANFTPNKNNYIDWNSHRSKSERRRPKSDSVNETTIHLKEELDAAEALANLACNYRQRLLNSTNYSF